jgi:hypothetical protein
MSAASWRASSAPRHSGIRVNQRSRRDAERVPAARRSGAELEVRFLSEIVSAHADVRASIDEAFSAPPARGPDLVTLRGDLRGRLDQLLEALLGLSEERDAVDALVPFVFFVDEQVELALAVATDPGTHSWLQLQRDLFSEGRAEGGDVFYERAEALLAEQTPRTTVIAAYLFCLKANFRGRLAGEPDEAVDQWIDGLAALLPSGARQSAVRNTSWRTPRPVSTYAALAVTAILAWHFVVSAWAYWR